MAMKTTSALTSCGSALLPKLKKPDPDATILLKENGNPVVSLAIHSGHVSKALLVVLQTGLSPQMVCVVGLLSWLFRLEHAYPETNSASS